MDNTKMILAVAGGYFLGRTKKLKLALQLAGMVTGQKMDTSARGLLSQASSAAKSNPEIAKLQTELFAALRTVALAQTTARLESISSGLRAGMTDQAKEVAEQAEGVAEKPKGLVDQESKETTEEPQEAAEGSEDKAEEGSQEKEEAHE